MGWEYEQVTGRILKGDIFVYRGYAGREEGLNNPLFQYTSNLGPLPQGEYDISPDWDLSHEHGPYVLRLTPRPGTYTNGRGGFLIHGDEKEHPGLHLASHGCIILPLVYRKQIHESGDRYLKVISGLI